jgi:hypothetical protein
MRASPAQYDFRSGEISPLCQARANDPKYKSGLKKCFNYLPLIQGPKARKPGSYYVASAKNQALAARLQPFKFSATDACVLEFGDIYVRFFKDDGQILSGGVPYEVVTPYLYTEVFDLQFVPTANTIYILHPSHAPRKLTRVTDTSWTLTTVSFLDGPYYNANTTGTTLTLSSATPGSGITLTASSATGINGGSGFLTTDVGRQVRLKCGSTWVWYTITSRTNNVSVQGILQSSGGSTAATATWRLGFWSDTTGYPACGVFHQDRLVLGGGNVDFPQRIDMSNTGDYENFAPTDSAGTVSSSSAIAATLRSNDVNSLYWFVSDEKGLLAGTSGGEWWLTSVASAISPTDIDAKQVTRYGSEEAVAPAEVGKSVMFVQQGGRILREMNYNFFVSGFRSPNRTTFSEHITQTGIVQMAYQKAPYSILYCLRTDGNIAAMTYEHDEEQNELMIGWAELEMANFSSDGLGGVGDKSLIESIAVIPSVDGDHDELWLLVNRIAGNPFGGDGGNHRYIERFATFFNETDDTRDAFFVDSGLTYDDPLVLSNSSWSGSGPYTITITVTAHGYSNGDTVRLSGFTKSTADYVLLEEKTFTISNVTTDTFDITGFATSGSTFLYAATCRKCVNTVSGLDHLDGNTVAILADGAVMPPVVVSGGEVSLPGNLKASRIHAGLPYNSRGQLLRQEAGSADGTSFGKNRRTHRVAFDIFRTLGLEIGADFDHLDLVPLRENADDMGVGVPLFTGVFTHELDLDYDFDNALCWQQSQPVPGIIRGVYPILETQDRG